MMTGDEDVLTGFRLEYRRAVAAAQAAQAAAEHTHTALFDFAGELGRIVHDVVDGGNPLGLGVRFIRRAPPRLDAPTGVHVEDAPKERAPSFAAVVLETPDLWFEVRNDPAQGFQALTNVPGMEAYAARICGVVGDGEGRPHLLQRVAGGDAVAVPEVNEAAQLLEVFLVIAGEVYARRTGMDRSAPR